MLNHVVVGASSLLKRSVEDGSKTSNWALGIFTLETLIFLPVFVFVSVPQSASS